MRINRINNIFDIMLDDIKYIKDLTYLINKEK